MAAPVLAKKIEVILVQARVGKGIEGDPVRIIHQYWSLDGTLLAERDFDYNETTNGTQADSDGDSSSP